MKYRITFRSIATMIPLLVGFSANASTTLVDIDFDSLEPGTNPDTSGVAGPGDLPITRFVETVFGTQVVTSAGNPLDSRAIRFLTTDAISPNFSYSQVRAFDLANSSGASDRYLLTMDFRLSGFEKRLPALVRSVDEFSILFDFPETRRLDFTTNGTTGQISYNHTPVYVGEFSFDTTHSLRILIDTRQNQWSVGLDGEVLFENVEFFNPDRIQQLEGIRLNLTDDATLASQAGAFIDNIVLIESPSAIPEPSNVILIATGVAMGLFRRRNQFKGS